MDHDGTLVRFTRHGMGEGEPELTLDLASKWLQIVLGNDIRPGAMAFRSEGVRLCCSGSPVLELLQEYERLGTHLILCKTCLDRFGLADEVRVGVVGGMGDIVAAQFTATKVLSL